MPRRKAWNGDPPGSPEEARRRLLDAARDCIEKLGLSRAGLSDVAEAAGVTRQTVYRHFESTDDLFHSAAALASGGFYERLHTRARSKATAVERISECLVFAITEIPRDPQLSALTANAEVFNVESALKLGFVQEEALSLGAGELGLEPGPEMDSLAELLIRLLLSFLADPSPTRDEDSLRAFLLQATNAILTTAVHGSTTT